MREILFRGKRIDNGEWVYGDLVQSPAHCVVQIYEQNLCGDNFAIDPSTVGQYTGLTDKNDRKIFENGYMIIDNKTYKVIFDNAEYILTNIFNCDIITLKNNSIKGVFVDEI